MYCNKENVNILTALLVAHGVRHAVCCPGSRNAPIVHNLNECPDIQCYPVTDERSAGFYALGMSQALSQPVAVCVTSGTALLNLAPAVAEAYYQQRPLVVISADRPPQWIDQLDGQTLPQPDALGRFVRKAVSLPEVISSPPKLGGVRGGLNEGTDALVHTTPPAGTPPDSGGESFPEGLYDIFNVRTESWQERMPLLLAAIDLCRPDLVILDGVRDLVDDINNGQLAHDVTERLMRVAQQARCCIVCVIHQNKAAEDRTLRGSIGTELTNKAFEVYECEKMMPSRTFVLTQKLTRKYDITDSLYFTVDDRGLPHQVGAPVTGERKTVVAVEVIARQTGLKAKYLVVHEDGSWEVNYQQLFREALAGRGELCGGELRDRVMGLCGMKSAFQYSEMLEKAKADGILSMRKAGKRHYYWLAAPD